MGTAVAAADNNAIGAVVPTSSNKDEEAYVGVAVAFEGACIGAFADGAGSHQNNGEGGQRQRRAWLVLSFPTKNGSTRKVWGWNRLI